MNKHVLRISGVAAALLVIPALSFAQVPANVQAQLDLIANLTRQIQALQQQLNTLQTQRTETLATLTATLRQGARGDQVRVLQALLAANPDIYPEGLITGLYGPATARAVKRFQKANGLDQVGVVGPKTLKKLNDMLSASPVALESAASGTIATSEKRVCAIVPPGHLIAPGWLRKQGGVRPIVPECQTLPPGIAKKLGTATSTPTSTVDLVSPVISAITLGTTTGTATISWTTNEPADSQIVYGETTAYGSSTALDSTLRLSHAQTISGLNASTTYHFQARSKDAAQNLATSSDQTFTTASGALADTSAPVISAVASTAGTSTAVVTWTTNEPANSQVLFGTSSAYGSSTALDSALLLSHSQTVTGLAPASTYHFQVRSADAAGNTGTTTNFVFSTAVLADTTPPIISSVSATGTASTAAISWITSEPTTGKLYYSTSTPLSTQASSTLSVTFSALATSTLADLIGLNASTTYYYVVEATDSATNRTTTAEQNFTTLQ